MGSAASWGSRKQTSPETAAETLITREEWERQGREMLSRLRIIPPVQRWRAESVGYPTQNGIYWVYWRPKTESRQQVAGGKTGNQGVISFEENKKTDWSRNCLPTFSIHRCFILPEQTFLPFLYWLTPLVFYNRVFFLTLCKWPFFTIVIFVLYCMNFIVLYD